MLRTSTTLRSSVADETRCLGVAAGASEIGMGISMSWTREDWCRALEERFFTERSAALPVLFFIDEEVLGEIYDGEAGDAVDSIIETVRRRLGQPGDHNGYFHRIEREGRRWKLDGGSGSPPRPRTRPPSSIRPSAPPSRRPAPP